MPYSSPSAVRQVLYPPGGGALSAPATNTAADYTDAQLLPFCTLADSMVDGYLATRYAVPVSNPPAVLTFWSTIIAVYNATCAYRGSLDFTDQDPIARLYAEVQRMLGLVATGVVLIDAPQSGSPNEGGAGRAINRLDGSLFPPDDFNIEPNVYVRGARRPGWPVF